MCSFSPAIHFCRPVGRHGVQLAPPWRRGHPWFRMRNKDLANAALRSRNKWASHQKCSVDPKTLLTAEKVVAEKLRLPSRAGLIDTVALLPPDQAAEFVDGLGRLIPKDDVPPPLPHPHYMVDAEQEERLRRRLWSLAWLFWRPKGASRCSSTVSGSSSTAVSGSPIQKGSGIFLIAVPRMRASAG